MQILGISGSLRKGSYNTALLRAFGELLPEGAEMEIYLPGDIPLYNSDLDKEERPEAVTRFTELVTQSDAILFATPEYNHGIPGLLKNAIDWASRPAFKSPLTHKPAGIISASMSPVGGARGQAALRSVLSGTLTPVLPHVEMLVPVAREKIDDAGRLTDSRTAERLGRYAAAFIDWVRSTGQERPRG